MEERQIRNYFAPNWVFRLYNQKSIPYLVLVIGVPAVIWVAGAIVALALGVFQLFVGNPLSFPVGPGFALAAYGWFAWTFPRLLATLYPNLQTSPEYFGGIIQKWANRIANRIWIMILFSIPLALLSFGRISALWNSPELNWIGTAWVKSSQPGFFALYYIIYDTIVGSFLLGSGAAGILGCVVLLYELLKLPLKLAYYRNLRVIGNFSIGLAGWAFVAFVFVGVAQVLIGPELFTADIASKAALPTIITSIVASIALLAALFAPVLFAHQTIIDAKYQQISGLQEVQNSAYRQIEQITALIAKAPIANGAEIQAEKSFAELIRQREQLETTVKLIEEIESIPEWPLTWRGTVQIIGAAITPILGSIASTIQSTLFPK